MRHGSERVPGKNFRTFGDRPLFHHIVTTLLDCPSIQGILIDTDSEPIKSQCAEFFPSVQVVDRPEELRAGTVPMNDVLRRDASLLECDLLLQTHSTNPLLTSPTIERAISAFLADDEADSLFSVTRLHTRLWREDGTPMNHDPAVLLRTQDLPPVFEENSNLYLFSRQLMVNTGNRIGSRPMMFEVDPLEALDIDEETDFVIAEAVWRTRSGSP